MKGTLKLVPSYLLAFVFLLFPIAHFKVIFFGLPLYLSEIPLLFALGLFLFEWREYRERFKEMWRGNQVLFLGMSLFLLGATLSYALNPHTLTGLGMLKSFFAAPLLLVFLLLLFVDTRGKTERILWLWLGGLAVASWASLFFGTDSLTYDHRLRWIYSSPNYLAMLLAPGLLLSLYFFPLTKKKLTHYGMLFFFGILLLSLLFTQSFGAMTSIFLSLGLFFGLNRKNKEFFSRKLLLTFGICVFFIFILLVSSQKFQGFLHGDARSSLASREMIWQSSIKILQDHILFGIGPGNFQAKYLEYQRYFPPYLEWAVPEPHNVYLALWLSTGLIGLAGLFLVLGVTFRRFFKVWQQKNLSTHERFLGSLLLSLLFFFLVYGLVDTPYFKNDLAFAFWGALGLLMTWVRRLETEVIEFPTHAIGEKEC